MVGLSVGLTSFAGVARYLTSLLYGITAWDAPALALSILLLTTAALAVAFPAWQATTINPSLAIREES